MFLQQRKWCSMLTQYYFTTGIPSAPRNLRTTSTVEDLRTGFLGHAVITLEWDLPEESNLKKYISLMQPL